MRSENIKKLFTYYNNKIDDSKEKIRSLQRICKHSDADHVFGSNTGNYDPSADCYWAEHKCNICGLRWRTDSNWQYHPPNEGWQYNRTNKNWNYIESKIK